MYPCNARACHGRRSSGHHRCGHRARDVLFLKYARSIIEVVSECQAPADRSRLEGSLGRLGPSAGSRRDSANIIKRRLVEPAETLLHRTESQYRRQRVIAAKYLLADDTRRDAKRIQRETEIAVGRARYQLQARRSELRGNVRARARPHSPRLVKIKQKSPFKLKIARVGRPGHG